VEFRRAGAFVRRPRSLFSLGELRAHRNGRGTLLLGPPPLCRTFGDFYTHPSFSHAGVAPGFYDIPDVRSVLEPINRLRGAAR
jgi:hypothetical protein